MEEYELKPKYENVKSYYNKAKILKHISIENKQITSLYSYETLVCYLKDNEVFITKNKKHLTQTTLRHIREFLKQNNFKDKSKKEMLKDYKEIKEK